jgi:hypothetical protein
MLLLLTEQQGLSRDDAYSLMSVAADFSVTQVIDARQGIHCKIPRSIFPAKWKTAPQHFSQAKPERRGGVETTTSWHARRVA